MRRGRITAVIAALAAAASAAPGVPAEDELAKRTFANAEQLMREGKIEQALRDFEQVSRAYPESRMADDALYRMGQYYYPAETVDALGRASKEAMAKAKDLFSRINAKYPREDSAPRALFKLGLIALDPSNPGRDLDEAYAAFSGVVNIYPSSDVLDRALFGAGFSDFMAGRYDKSIASFERVAEEFARDGVAEEARYYMGLAHARQGSYIRALEEFQEARNRHPSGRLAGSALDRLTQIYKLKVQPGLGIRPLFLHDASYKPGLDPGALRGDVLLAIDQESVAHALDVRSGAVWRLGHDGRRMPAGTPLPGAVSISVNQAGVELLAAGDRFRVGVETIVPGRLEGGQIRPIDRITAAAPAGLREVALLDEARNEVLAFSGDPSKPRLLYRDPAGRARLTGLAAGAEGRLYTIDRRSRRILQIAPDGAFKEVPMPPEADRSLQEPAAIAADDLGTLFVLDRRTDSVVVMTAQGKLLETIVSAPGTPREFSYPSSIAAGPRGEIYIYDAKRKTILRFW